MADGRRSIGTLAAFAGPCIPLAAFGLPLVITVPTYYSETLGVNLALVGYAFLAVRLLDVIFDPIFGTVLDRTRWSFGRFRSWLAISVPILMGSIYMLFFAKEGVGFWYLFTTLLFVYGGYSIAVLSHTSWAATLSTDYNERSKVYGWWQTFNVVGMICILGLPIILGLAQLVKGPDDVIQYQGWFILALLPIMVGIAVWRVKETPSKSVSHAHDATLADYFRLIRRPTVVRILLADLLTGLAPGITGILYFFYFTRVKGFTGIEPIALLLVYFLAAVFGAVIWTTLAKRTGKAKALIAGCVVYAIVQFVVVMLPAGNFLLAIPFLIAAGLPFSAGPLLLRSMMADYADEERLMTGQDRTGLLYAILTGTVKIGTALASLSLITLEAIGFDAKTPALSTPLSMQGLEYLYAFAPGIIGLLAAACMIGYPLTEAKHADILRQLGEKDGAVPPPQPEDLVAVQPVSITPDVLPKPAD
ncbi:MFS transporter [Caulobacter sp. SLTY]|uniref:MFS transporter n=1 Tax=Caulobacter sp. SLTY TaxID=2683262 RepID=UPI001413721A|nr:MFS transporter [Caulobacter sp. SLTY]NBB17386.1 MFS transporter [Caulobacter sp. SLTY]